MDNIRFYNSFKFTKYSFKNERSRDNTCGIDCHFIGRMQKGSAHIITDEKTELHLEKGDVFYLPYGLRYCSRWFPDETGSVEWDSFRFDCFPCKDGKRYVMQKIFPSRKAWDQIEEISNCPSVSCASVGLLYSILGDVIPQMKQAVSDSRQELLEKAKQYMREHHDFSVPDLAQYCNISESGLYAFFNSYAHTTPIEMKNRIKTEQAISLLISTDLSVEEISNRLGYQSTAYFRRIIKKQSNKTPSQIRKEQFFEI